MTKAKNRFCLTHRRNQVLLEGDEAPIEWMTKEEALIHLDRFKDHEIQKAGAEFE